eukprot:scaffold610_cov169-Ochromonas_danica.AAC.8
MLSRSQLLLRRQLIQSRVLSPHPHLLYLPLQQSTRGLSESKEKIVYEGKWAKSLQWAKRITFSTSVLGVLALYGPFYLHWLYLEAGLVPYMNVQIAMAVLSVSLTSCLHYYSSPYVYRLVEIPSRNGKDRYFRVTKLKVHGGFEEIVFALPEAAKPEEHPLATCQTNRCGPMYFAAPELSDEELKVALLKKQ